MTGACEPLSFALGGWAAWSPGLDSRAAWEQWARGAELPLPAGDGQPAVAAMPALLRRRAQRQGRLALEVLYASAADDTPIVYCSRHGELQRAVDLLTQLADTGAVSPQDFSMAVHNAIAGLHTIATGTQPNVVALSGGGATAIAGLVEACGLLADGATRVRLILVDEALPAVYAAFGDEPPCAYAIALELAPGKAWALRATPPEATPPRRLPLSLALAQCLIGSHPQGRFTIGDRSWTLDREA